MRGYRDKHASLPTIEEQARSGIAPRPSPKHSPRTRHEWNGPSLYEDVLPPLSSDLAGQEVQDGYRLPHHPLLSSSGPARSTQLHSLRLVEPLQTGVAWSQIWRCQGSRASWSAEKQACDVVVKFLDEALFPYPEGRIVDVDVDEWDWWSADNLEGREGDA